MYYKDFRHHQFYFVKQVKNKFKVTLSQVKNGQSGFTLIETIIYIALLGTIVVSFISFIMAISGAKEKNYVVQEVNSNSQFALSILSQQVKLAHAIITPTPNNPDDYLVLDMGSQPDVAFGVNAGVLGMSVAGSSATTTLTSDKVNVTHLVFTNLSPVGVRNNLKIDLTLEYRDNSSQEYVYDNTWHTAVTPRQ